MHGGSKNLTHSGITVSDIFRLVVESQGVVVDPVLSCPPQIVVTLRSSTLEM